MQIIGRKALLIIVLICLLVTQPGWMLVGQTQTIPLPTNSQPTYLVVLTPVTSAKVGQTAVVQVRLLDQFGVPIANESIDAWVQRPVSGGMAISPHPIGTTNAAGNLSYSTSSSKIENVVVQFSVTRLGVAGPRAAASVTFGPTVSPLPLPPSGATPTYFLPLTPLVWIEQGEAGDVKAQLLDQGANPVGNEAIDVVVSSQDPFSPIPKLNISTRQETTDINGIVSTSLVSQQIKPQVVQFIVSRFGLAGPQATAVATFLPVGQPAPPSINPCDVTPKDAEGRVLPTTCDRGTPGDMYDGLVAATSGPCKGAFEIVGVEGVCTHGPDYVRRVVVDPVDEVIAPKPTPSPTPTTPSAPTGLTATAASSSAINLAWSDNSNNEEGFEIERADTPDGPFEQIGTVGENQNSFSDTGLPSYATFAYRVRAFNSAGDSPHSNTASGTTDDVLPTAPTSLAAQAGSESQITLSWTDNSANEQGFKIERATASAGPYSQVATTSANASTYVDNGLAALTTYYYRLRAFNTAGNSAFSNNASATTHNVPTPGAPSSLTATTQSSSGIGLTWRDNSSDEDGFKLERSTNAAGPFAQIAVVAANVTSLADSGLGAATTYYYRARAFNIGGDSAYSNTASATTHPNPPAAPTGFIARASSRSVVALSWTDNSENEQGFKLHRATSSGGPFAHIATTGPNTVSYTDSALGSSTTYYYELRAFNTGGESIHSSASVTTLQDPPPAPTNLNATAVSLSQINLSWTDNASAESGFKIERALNQAGPYTQISVTEPNNTAFADKGLSSGTRYYYRVRAFSSAGDSSYSNDASATTYPAPPPEEDAYDEPGYDETTDSDYQASMGSGTDPAGTSAAEEAAVAQEDNLCVGDGKSGFRVQAVYAVAKDQDSRYLKERNDLRVYAHRANHVYFASSASGNRRKIRFVCNSNNQIAVRKVVVPAQRNGKRLDENPVQLFKYLRDDVDFRTNKSIGLARFDRKYMIWIDRVDPNPEGETSYVCGIGEVPTYRDTGQDKRRNSGSYRNIAETGPTYGATFYPLCAGATDKSDDGNTESHELMHTLGAVHPDAPHATEQNPNNEKGGLHCWDRYDNMCYDDYGRIDGTVWANGREQAIAFKCTPKLPNENRFDCGNDDYFNSKNVVDGWLGKHWNAADSRFLIPNTGATRLDCSPETATNTQGTSHTLTCRTQDGAGGLISGALVDIEAVGANDPDGTNSRTSPDFTCRTNSDGVCSVTHNSSVGVFGTTTYRAWIDEDGNNSTVEADATEGQDEGASPGERKEPDDTDAVTKTWI